MHPPPWISARKPFAVNIESSRTSTSKANAQRIFRRHIMQYQVSFEVLNCGVIVVVAEYLDSLREQQHTVRQIIVHKNGDCCRTTKFERGFQPTLCGRCGAYAIDTGLMAEVMHDRHIKKLMSRSVQKVALRYIRYIMRYIWHCTISMRGQTVVRCTLRHISDGTLC